MGNATAASTHTTSTSPRTLPPPSAHRPCAVRTRSRTAISGVTATAAMASPRSGRPDSARPVEGDASWSIVPDTVADRRCRHQHRGRNRTVHVPGDRLAPPGTWTSANSALEQAPRHHDLLNLVGALVDLGDLGVAHHALHREVAGVAR